MQKVVKKIISFTYLIPFFWLIFFVIKFSVNVPFNDEWVLVTFFNKLASKNLTFQDFASFHNDHRMFFPRIIFFLVGITSQWNVRLEMYLGVILSGLSFYLLFKISQNNQNTNKIIFSLTNLITAFLFFSLIQIENWLWGFQVAWFWINFWIILAIFILTTQKICNPNLKLYLAAFCCFIASFSSAQGLFSWLSLLPCILTLSKTKKNILFNVIIWLILFFICAVIYLDGYETVNKNSDTILNFQNILIAINYFFTLIGNSLFLPKFNNTQLIGLLIFITFISLNIIIFILISKNKINFYDQITPWISLGLFSLIFCFITTIGRFHLGVNHALASRYTTVSILLLISCVQLSKVLITINSSWFSAKFYRYFSIYFIFGNLLFLTIYNSLVFFQVGYAYSLQRSYGKSCVEIISFFDNSFFDPKLQIFNNLKTKNCLDYIGTPNELKQWSENFKQLKWINFTEQVNFVTNSNLSYGEITEVITSLENDHLILKGWAHLPQSNQRPDGIFLSFDDQKLFFTNAVIKDHKFQDKIDWEAKIALQLLPTKNSLIHVWVYDRQNRQFILLKNKTQNISFVRTKPI